MPHQFAAANPVMPSSARVGICGVNGVRFSLVTARARSFPLLMLAITGWASENIIGM